MYIQEEEECPNQSTSLNDFPDHNCVELRLLDEESARESESSNIMLLWASDPGVSDGAVLERLFQMRGRGWGSMTDMSTCVVDTVEAAAAEPLDFVGATPMGGFALAWAILRILIWCSSSSLSKESSLNGTEEVWDHDAENWTTNTQIKRWSIAHDKTRTSIPYDHSNAETILSPLFYGAADQDTWKTTWYCRRQEASKQRPPSSSCVLKLITRRHEFESSESTRRGV